MTLPYMHMHQLFTKQRFSHKEVTPMKQARYTTRLDAIGFPGKRFLVTCPDVVIRNAVADFVTEKGGILSVQDPDYLIYTPGHLDETVNAAAIRLTSIQFWLAARALDRIQRHEWVEASLAYLGSDSPFAPEEEEKILWYIRDNRDKVVDEMLRMSATESIAGFLGRCRRVLPEAFTRIGESFDDQILLDLTDELIEKAALLEKHEVKAFLLEYKQAHLSGDFVEQIQQSDMEKELGFQERNEYDWMKLFTYTTEDDGIHISGYTGTDELVFIPDSMAGKPVTTIHMRNFFTDDRNLQFYWQRPAFLDSPVDLETLQAAQVGDSVFFGRYPQTKTASMEPIEWKVLKREGSRLLVISALCLDKAPYHWDPERIDWEHCQLRRWFNGPFYQLAFTPAEQAMIPAVTLPPAPNEKYRTVYANATEDRVFALSSTEAAELFPDDASRIGYTTAYHQVQGYYFGGRFNCWWLRTPGVDMEFVTLVGNSGSIGTYGYRVDNNEYAARPAMWIETGGQA